MGLREEMFAYILQMSVLVCPETKRTDLINLIDSIGTFKDTNEFMFHLRSLIGNDTYESIKMNYSKNVTHGAYLFGKKSQLHLKTNIGDKIDVDNILDIIKNKI
jgi:hypothetical protein